MQSVCMWVAMSMHEVEVGEIDRVWMLDVIVRSRHCTYPMLDRPIVKIVG